MTQAPPLAAPPNASMPAWLQALLRSLAQAKGEAPVEIIETHISWVLLAGDHAYKIKKPVDLGFANFSTLEKRRHFCQQELRLNRRLAPQLYLDVVTVNGTPDTAHLGAPGTILDYAVHMRAFPKDALASAALQAGRLTPAHFDALAVRIAAFHDTAGVAAAGSPYGAPEAIHAAAGENFRQLARLLTAPGDSPLLTGLREWTQAEYERLWPLFNARLAASAVRECHGDLHLGNLVLLEDTLVAFDCIEFNPALRWIDIMNEVAFLMMDLVDRGRPAFAWRFLNDYLDATGAHDGLAVLRFYLVYRALVRAKVHALRAGQNPENTSERERLFAVSREYLSLAVRFAARARPALLLMHGLSGSGKSVIAQALADAIGAVHVRSDVERKRLAGLGAFARSHSNLHAGLYTPEHTESTYGRLGDVARGALEAGWHVVVDATFLASAKRERFRRIAAQCSARCLIIDVTAPESELRQRIDARSSAGRDASEANQAVLSAQIASAEPLAEEMTATIVIDSAQGDARTVAQHAVARVQQWFDEGNA